MSAETINMRTDSERKQRLQLAADLSHQSLTSFVLSAADDRAEQVIAQARMTTVPSGFFDDFFDAIAPDPESAVEQAAARMRRTVRRDA